jgi:hypothetical protein
MVLGSDLRRGNEGRGSGGPGKTGGTVSRTTAARSAALAAAAVLAFALTSCGDDNGGDSTAPTPTAETTTGEATPSETRQAGPDDPEAAEKEVRANWAKFFDPATSTDDKKAVLENGELMGPVLAAFSGDERGQQVEAKVTGVEFTSATEANVTYSLLMKGATVLPDSSGTAVEEDGTWKVSVKTLCGLVGLSGNASPAAGC